MKLLVDARTFGDKPSGIGIYTYNFLKEIVKHNDINVELVSDISNSDEIKNLTQYENVTLHLMGKRVQKTFAVIGYVRYIQTVIDKVKPDVFWEPNNLFPIKLVNPYGKIVVTIHDMFPLYMPENYGKIYPHYFRYGIQNTLKYTDGIIYNSEETKRITEKYFPRAEKKISDVLYIPIEQCVNTPISDENYMLYIGNLEKRKGTDILLKAFERYRAAGGEKRLVLAGKVREEDIKTLIDEISQKTKAVEYKGYISEQEKDALLAKCSCFVFPSRAEGFGIPIVEAMYYKKPIIVSDLSIFREIVGDVVYTFDLNDWEKALPKLMKENHGLKIAEYEAVCERYKPETLANRLLEYFEGWTKNAKNI